MPYTAPDSWRSVSLSPQETLTEDDGPALAESSGKMPAASSQGCGSPPSVVSIDSGVRADNSPSLPSGDILPDHWEPLRRINSPSSRQSGTAPAQESNVLPSENTGRASDQALADSSAEQEAVLSRFADTLPSHSTRGPDDPRARGSAAVSAGESASPSRQCDPPCPQGCTDESSAPRSSPKRTSRLNGSVSERSTDDTLRLENPGQPSREGDAARQGAPPPRRDTSPLTESASSPPRARASSSASQPLTESARQASSESMHGSDVPPPRPGSKPRWRI